MIVLGIESTCDETAASIVRDGNEILSNVIASQINIHKEFGGVFPEVASREHVNTIIPVIEEAISTAGITKEDIDLIAVAKGPGLIGSLLIGINAGKTISMAWDKPIIGINHIEAHLYAAMMGKFKKLLFPAIGVVLSGGHTEILRILNIGQYITLGKTIDDAIGEAFDKVATMLDLPYPGGPEIEALAKQADQDKYKFKSGKTKNNPYNFSFSGLKTKVLYTLKGQKANKNSDCILCEEEKKHIAASFQKTAFMDVIEKISLSTKNYNTKAIYLGGGVTNNQTLRYMLSQKKIDDIPIFWPGKNLSLDNAAMIAGLGYHKFSGIGDSLSFNPMTRIPLV
jgi:N6-L-threonylcarbamoyladenine synthase